MGSMGASGDGPEPVAIVGMSCRFAGEARSPEKLWKLLTEKKSAWTAIPPSRFNAKGSYHHDPETLSAMNVKGGHFIDDDIATFDAPFFGLSAETAAAMDPQFRLQLESVYEALENAGITLEQVAGSDTSVYAGLWVQDYRDNLIRDEDDMPRFFATGTGAAFAANRISHFFDLRGASMTIDTGCSTTLVALHQAIQALRNRECEMAIVGGSNVMLNPDTFKTMASAGFLSADGKSYAFDSRANGYGRGDGVATIVLKRPSDAVACGDPVRGIIRETLLNQDGRTESITTPSQEAQVQLMRECYRKAKLDHRDTQYFEAHGTGTKTGDPIEARAVATVFQRDKSLDQALRVGSVKTNIGHTEVTSGLASIIKVVLALERRMIPPSVNFETANENVLLDDWHLKVVEDLEPWTVGPSGVRRASVNNFGYGGTNAHAIIEEASSWNVPNGVPPPPSNNKSTCGVLTLSAKSEQACRDMVVNLQQYLDDRADTTDAECLLRDLLYTLSERRSNFPWVVAQRISLTAGLNDASAALEAQHVKPLRNARQPRIGMVFTGQGAQWHAMGRELIDSYPAFRAILEEADGYLSQMGADWSLMEELHRDAESSRVNDTCISIPICVALQIALVQLLRAWGIVPAAVTSHSSGEIAAAYTVGALNLKSAMAAAYHRAALTAAENLRRATKGGMVAVGLGIEDTERYLEKLSSNGKAVAACINSPYSVTVAGDMCAVQEVEDMMKADGIFARRLRVEAAYHSHHMESSAEPYRNALYAARLEGESQGDLEAIAYSSPVTGGRILSAADLAQPEHWVDSMVQPVQFVDALIDMVLGDFDPTGSSIDLIIEVGPHTALGGAVKDTLGLPEFNGLQLPYYGCLARNTDARHSLQDLAASLLRGGCPVNLAAVNFPLVMPTSLHVLTDLPSYSWGHQIQYWRESRINYAIRQRSQPRHNLLGSVAPWSGPSATIWRHTLRADDTAWLRDHNVQSSIVYPGGGFICLAIEAINQELSSNVTKDHISAFRLRDIDIRLALVVPDNADGIEVQTILSPVSDKAIGTTGWKNFEVTSVSREGKWTQHATGMITAEFGQAWPSRATKKLNGYKRRFQPESFYRKLRGLGLKHGPKFQNLTSIVQSSQNREAVATFIIAANDSADDVNNEEVIHPTTLDTIVQAAYTALPGAGSHLDSPMVPRHIEQVRVSRAIPRDPGKHLEAWSSLVHADEQGLRANISVFNSNLGAPSPVLEIDGLAFQSLGKSSAPEIDGRPWEKEVCNTVEWAPDVSLATPAYYGLVKETLAHALDPAETNIIQDLRRVCIYFMQDALASLSPREAQQLEGHRGKYYTWLTAQLDLAASGKLGPSSAQWTQDDAAERAQRIENATHASVNGEMVCQLGPHLGSMLRGEQPPLELMMQNRLLYKYYSHMLKCSRSFEHAAYLLQNLVHKTPRARILEIGAGTGGETRYALPAIGTSARGGPLASLYHFTDVSPAFFEAAGQEFSEWSEILKFDKLDIERDPASQGFETGSYDIVIACQVLHATKSMASTMANVRKLLKPSGTLLMVETTKDQVDVQFVFGLLPGWWLSEEEERQSSPSLSISLWDDVLKAAGFSGVDFEIHDCESEELYSISTLVSSARTPQPFASPAEDFLIVTSEMSLVPEGWVDALGKTLSDGRVGSSLLAVQTLETADPAAYTGKICIFIGEATGESLLFEPSTAAFTGLKAMAATSRGLLWVTKGGAIQSEMPHLGLATGFLRTLRNEYVGRKFLALDLDADAPTSSDQGPSAIARVLQANFGGSTSALDDTTPVDFEYAERGGNLMIPRICKDMGRNAVVFPKPFDFSRSASIPHEMFEQASRPLSLQVGVAGSLETLAFSDDQTESARDARPAKGMVEIQPLAYGVNFRDVMVAMGQLEERIMGVECSGRITKIDPLVQGLEVGDSVMCLLRGPRAFGSHVSTESTNVVRMPSGLSFEEAASLPSIFSTAYYSLCELARLKQGQTVLVHAAAGGVGQAAVMLAQHVGAHVFATVGSPAKRKLLMDEYQIPSSRIFSSRDVSFKEAVLTATDNHGVDVVVNSLAGPLLQASFDVLSPFGHFVEIGKSDLERNSSLEMRPFTRQVSFSSVDIMAMMRLRPQDIHNNLAEVARLVNEKAIGPVRPLTVMPIADIEKAFRLIQTGKHSGKVVLSIEPQAKVPALPRHHGVQLSAAASYLLVGGIGGVGQSIATWLAERGARNIVLLSRSAGDLERSKDIIEQLKQAGCWVKAISCDAANSEDLDRALRECEAAGLPPVRGVVQGAMVLKDSILEQMSVDDYYAAIRPKVMGTANLHSRFPNANDLDFFVILSSNVGILGNASQANYSAGGSYQDALARWRVAHGLPCVSIDLAAVKSVGFVAETAGVWSRMEKLGHMSLEENVVRAVVESAILNPGAGQIVAGINGGPGSHWDPASASQLGRDARFTALRYRQQQQQQHSGSAKGGEGQSLSTQLTEATSRAGAERLISQAVAQKLADIFTIPVEDIDMAKSPGHYGIDSLVAVELRNMLTHKIGSEMSSFGIMQSTSLDSLAKEAAAKSRHVNSELQ